MKGTKLTPHKVLSTCMTNLHVLAAAVQQKYEALQHLWKTDDDADSVAKKVKDHHYWQPMEILLRHMELANYPYL